MKNHPIENPNRLFRRMSLDWDDFDYEGPTIASLLPSSLKDLWDDPHQDIPQQNGERFPKQHGGFIVPESAPIPSYITEPTEALTFMGEIEADISSPSLQQYYVVEFHPNRSAIFKVKHGLNIDVNDYVLTEADRGFDIGHVTSTIQRPTQRDAKNAKFIIRLASSHEVAQLAQKVQREVKALELCQTKAAELGLPMTITGAEFQFDGKKLTFYYTATSYVDFRNLVRSLFKIFGTRIWMVWYNGTAPVRDVFNCSE